MMNRDDNPAGFATATMFLMPDELLRYRSEFPILDRTTYLISNSLGAMPRGVEDHLHHYAAGGTSN